MKENSSEARVRDSGMELLRIVAMLMIVAHHMVLHNQVRVWGYSFSAKRLLFETMFEGVGKIGVICFFLISAWFLCEKQDLSLKSSFRRIWLMERELLFWSLMLYICVKISCPDLVSSTFKEYVIHPLSANMWWYATTYAVCLMLLPFIQFGLRDMGRLLHGQLCVVGLALLVVDGLRLRSLLDTMLVFVLLYVITAYYRWYMKPFAWWTGIVMAFVGEAVIVAVAALCGSLTLRDPRWEPYQLYLAGEWKLPVLVTACGLLLVFSNIHFRSRVVNWIAASTFGVYLISDYPLIRKLLWNRWFTLDRVYELPNVTAVVAAVAVVLLCCWCLPYAWHWTALVVCCSVLL